MKRKIWKYFVCMLLLFFGHTLAEGLKGIQLEKTLFLCDSTIEEEKTFFAFPRKVVTDSQGDIYILDRNRIIKFSNDGKFQWERGKIGQGPGEFANIQDIGIDERKGTLFCCDQDQLKIILYSTEGDFMQEFRVTMGAPYKIAVDSQGYIYIEFIMPHKNYVLHQFDTSGKLLNSFVEVRFKDKDEDLQIYKNWINFCVDRSDCLVLSYYYYNIVQKVNPNGILEKEWQMKLNYKPQKIKVVMPSPNYKKIEADRITQGIAVDNDNNIYVMWGGKSEEKGYRIDVYDNKGIFLTAFYSGVPTTDKEFQMLYIDRRNNLYILNPQENPSLTRYSVRLLKEL